MTSQEAKPYKNDPEIQALSNLVTAYMRHEIRQFEKLLKQNSRSVMGDPFIASDFDGFKDGYTFKSAGEKGKGYYKK